jgi:hypothetical protein
MHALLVAAMLTSWDVKPITPVVFDKPDDTTSLDPDALIIHREPLSTKRVKRIVEALNGPNFSGGFMDATTPPWVPGKTSAGFWSPTGGYSTVTWFRRGFGGGFGGGGINGLGGFGGSGGGGGGRGGR